MSLSLRVLLVEDEMLVAMLIEDMLTDLGHTVVGPAMHYDVGLDLAAHCLVDFAVLDVNLQGRRSMPIAEQLRKRGIPFFFATGYDGLGGEEMRGNARILKKPFSRDELAAAIAGAAAAVA